MRRFLQSFPLVVITATIAASLQPCHADPSNAVAGTVARALGYFEGVHDKRYSITDDWQALSGDTVVCVRAEVPNGAGGFAPTSDFSMFFLAKGVIVNMVKDNSLFGCPNRSYSALPPVRR